MIDLPDPRTEPLAARSVFVDVLEETAQAWPMMRSALDVVGRMVDRVPIGEIPAKVWEGLAKDVRVVVRFHECGCHLAAGRVLAEMRECLAASVGGGGR